MKIDPSLCVRCKGFKLLCGRPFCPILERYRMSVKTLSTVKNEFFGPTPPSAFVGERGYPMIRVGTNIVVGRRNPKIYDAPERWWGKLDVKEIIGLRASLIYSYRRWVATRPERMLSVMREAALSVKPVDIEVHYVRKPKPVLSFDSILQPIGPSAPIRRLALASNPSTTRAIEKVVYDTDLKAAQAHKLGESMNQTAEAGNA